MRKYFVLAALLASAAQAQNRSGLEFASEEIRRLQASDAENPGMLWVDQGAKLFAQKCASCHVSMKGVATRYPAVEDGRIVTLEAKVRHKEAFAYEWDEQRYFFARAEHRDMFKVDPVRYAPQFANYCAVALTRGELDEEVERLSARAGKTAEELRRDIIQAGRVEALAGDILRRKVLDYLVEQANITDEAITEG